MIENNTHLTLFILICYSIPWILKETKDINKLSNLFSLNSAFLTSIVSVLYTFTKNNIYLSLLPNVFIVGLFLDFINRLLFYPEHVDPLLTIVHHTVYIFFTLYAISINKLHILSYFMIEEIPTIILNIKRYYSIKNIKIDYLFGFVFLLLRIIYHSYICYYFKNELINDKLVFGLCILSFLLHCWWFYDWLKKYYFKNPDESKNQVKSDETEKQIKPNETPVKQVTVERPVKVNKSSKITDTINNILTYIISDAKKKKKNKKKLKI